MAPIDRRLKSPKRRGYPQPRQPHAAAYLLEPEIVESILDGRQAMGLQLTVLTGKLSRAWEEQRQLLPTTFARSA
jgi:hypothetical protein